MCKSVAVLSAVWVMAFGSATVLAQVSSGSDGTADELLYQVRVCRTVATELSETQPRYGLSRWEEDEWEEDEDEWEEDEDEWEEDEDEWEEDEREEGDEWI